MSFLEPGQSVVSDPADLDQNQSGSKFQKPTAPTPPDFKNLIDEQAKENRIDQTTPNGSLQFTTDPKTGQVSANMAYSPQMQAYANQLGGLQNQYASQGGPFKPQDNSAAVNSAEQSSYNDAMKLMQPQLDQQQAQLTQNMADRGLPVGSEIQQNSQQQFGQYESGLENQAAYNAIGQGQSLQNQLYGQQLGAYQSNMAGLGEVSQLQGALPGLNSFYSPTGVDVNGSANISSNAAQQNYNSQLQQYSSNMGGLTNAAGSLGALYMMSDRRKKHDIKRIGQTDAGLPLYSFLYNGSNDFAIGVMADEAKKMFPEAVMTHVDGYDRVDYSRIY